MIRKRYLAPLCALLLSGCDGWIATRQLIAADQRDSIGLTGRYESDERYLAITPLANNLYRITSRPIGVGEEEPGDEITAAFDLVRSERYGDDLDGYTYENIYLMEFPQKDDEGNVTYVYELVGSSYNDQDRSPTFAQYQVSCSAAANDIATGAESGCVFADYGEVRRAAQDALDWAADARMRIHRESFFRNEE